jgi:hypothetical protein
MQLLIRQVAAAGIIKKGEENEESYSRSNGCAARFCFHGAHDFHQSGG